ncbi:MAG: ribosomal-protein-alanine N-acetyltransferase [Alphaproteobacteria bacterium]|nr:ribosomal-protein-alanine N-acetyltransferase [Alphaproteobacteria bacterium]
MAAEIGPAGAYDATDLARVHAACFAETWDRETFARLLAGPGVHGLVARDRSMTVGFALVRVAADEAELLTLGVEPARRGEGLGRRLMLRSLDGARIRGARTLFLEVAADNSPARALYASLGFAQVGVRKGYYARGKDRVDALTLSRACS